MRPQAPRPALLRAGLAPRARRQAVRRHLREQPADVQRSALHRRWASKRRGSWSPTTSCRRRRATTRSTASSATSTPPTPPGSTPLVSFEHARGDRRGLQVASPTTTCRSAGCRASSEYEAAIATFLVRFPTVTVIAPWNECQPLHAADLARPASRAAQFTDSAAKVCKALGRNCTIVVIDVLDQADSAKAKKPTFKSTTKYDQDVPQGATRPSASICGIHNYSDVEPLPRRRHQGADEGDGLQASTG